MLRVMIEKHTVHIHDTHYSKIARVRHEVIFDGTEMVKLECVCL